MRPTVVLLGTLDTKGTEYDYFRRCLAEAEVDVILVDTGIHEPQGPEPDVDRNEVSRLGGESSAEVLPRSAAPCRPCRSAFPSCWYPRLPPEIHALTSGTRTLP